LSDAIARISSRSPSDSGSGLPVAQFVDEADFPGLDGGIGLRPGRHATRQLLGLQRIQDLIARDILAVGNGKTGRH